MKLPQYFKNMRQSIFYGKEFLTDLAIIIPGVLFPGKDKLLAKYGMPEKLWAELGVPFYDYSNTMTINRFADFSYFCFVFESMFDIIMFKMTYEIVMMAGRETMGYLCMFTFLYCFMQVEVSYGVFLGFARNYIIFLIVIIPVYWLLNLSSIKLRPRRNRLRGRAATKLGSASEGAMPETQ